MRKRRILMAVSIGLAATLMMARPAAAQFYEQHTLQTNATDPTLLNAWGLVSGPGTPWWVVNNGDDSSTLYTGAEVRTGPNDLRVAVPGGPTGIVFNGASSFTLPATGAVARFIFSTEGGADLCVGRRLGRDSGGDGRFRRRLQGAGHRRRRHSHLRDELQRGHGRHVRCGVAADPHGPVSGPQHSRRLRAVRHPDDRVDRLCDVRAAGRSEGGRRAGRGPRVRERVRCRWQLHSQGGLARAAQLALGIALAPADFGTFSNDLLIGNFGDGRIQAFNPAAILGNGQYQRAGILHSADGPPLRIDGLWALSFGKGVAANGNANSLYFTAGPDQEQGGAFGFLTAAPKPGE